MIDRTCMDPDELALWRAQAEYLRNQWTPRTTLDPCSDCIVAFSDEMRAAGRCNGTPGEGQPVPSDKPAPPGRRESNRLAAQRWRERHPGRRYSRGEGVKSA